MPYYNKDHCIYQIQSQSQVGHIKSQNPCKNNLDASNFLCKFYVAWGFRLRTDLTYKTETTTSIQVLSSAKCRLDLYYGERDRHPQSHLCKASYTSSVEQVSCAMRCKVSPSRFIPPYRKMQSTHIAKDDTSTNAHNLIVFYSCNRSTHRQGSDTTVGVPRIKTINFTLRP